MDALTCIETRRSIRKYQEKPIPHEVMEEIVKEASFAPSWKNSQVVRYVVVENPELKSKIANDAVLGFTYNTGTIEHAAALVVVTMIQGRSGYERDGSFTTSKTAGKCSMQVSQHRLSVWQRMRKASVPLSWESLMKLRLANLSTSKKEEK